MNRSISGQNVLFGLAAFLYVVLAFFHFKNAAGAPDATASHEIGYAIAPVIWALVVRGIYVGVRWRWSRVRFLSGWLLVMAAAFAFMGNLSLANRSYAARSETSEPAAVGAVTPMMVVNSWVSSGEVVLPTWCADVARYEDVAFAAFKKEYGTGEPSAEALWNELIRRC